MLVRSDKLNVKDMADSTDIGYTEVEGGLMSKLLMNQAEEKKAQSLLLLLKGAEKQPKETVEILKSSVHELVGLVELLLSKKPIILEDDLSPTEAGEIVGISRTSVMNMLKTGRLKGYEVGTHWRITRDSLLKYLEDRESMMQMMGEMDKAGFGLD